MSPRTSPPASPGRHRPPRIAFLGKAGTGKTWTINALFSTDWTVSHARVGTTKVQAEEFALSSGGSLVAVDLPGYGRTIREDAAYKEIYQEVLPTCDLVLLVLLQADTRDFTDDQQMIAKLAAWMKSRRPPRRDSNILGRGTGCPPPVPPALT